MYGTTVGTQLQWRTIQWRSVLEWFRSLSDSQHEGERWLTVTVLLSSRVIAPRKHWLWNR